MGVNINKIQMQLTCGTTTIVNTNVFEDHVQSIKLASGASLRKPNTTMPSTLNQQHSLRRAIGIYVQSRLPLLIVPPTFLLFR